MDFSAAITTALTGATAAFTDNLEAIIPTVLGIAGIMFVWRRVKGLVR